MLINWLEKYPQLFKNTHRYNMEIPEGWNDIVDKLCQQLIDINYQGEVTQMKEKFGSLRFYTNSFTEEAQPFIDATEKLSSSTCEVCGEWGEVSTKKYWMRTLCPKHVKEYEEK